MLEPLAPRPPRAATGFTTIELMVVVAIVAILAAIALPSFDRVIDRYRVRRTIEDLSATVYLARSEAIRRGGNVVLRKVSTTDCPTTKAGDWSCGWVIFVDDDANGQLGADETSIQMSPAPRNVIVTITPGDSFRRGDRWGKLGGMGAFGFEVKPTRDANDPASGQCLAISSGGRLNTSDGSCPPG